MQQLAGIGLLGCGTVGGSVAERLALENEALSARSGLRYELRAVAIRDAGKRRSESIERRLFTRDAWAVVDDPHVDVIVECIGGTDVAGELVERALDRGRHVVTANKALLATQGPRLAALAAARGVTLRFEAAVAGAVPIVRTLDDGLAGDEVQAVAGVLNGTCTTILSAMERGSSYDDALADAQARGFAESDPSSDVEGHDAAHKLALLVQLAFGLAVISPRIRHRGIAGVTKDEIERARQDGLRIRLVGAARRTGSGALAEVGPVLVPFDHPFAQMTGPENIVRVDARDAGTLQLRGPGAGGNASASAVLGDVVSVLRSIGERRHAPRRFRAIASEPAIDVSPAFDALDRHPELPRYPLWDDALLTAPASQEHLAFSLPGKDDHS